MIGRAMLPPRVREIAAAALAMEPEPEHARQVTWLAGRLFHHLRVEHGLTDPERELLLAAALLHDVGLGVSVTGHHKHSARLIETMALPGFDAREQTMIAAVARYHRKALPKKKHRLYGSLSKVDREIVGKLAAMLRIADGLDRTHDDVVRDVSVVRGGEALQIRAHATEDAELELWAANRKADMFAEVYGPVEVVGNG